MVRLAPLPENLQRGSSETENDRVVGKKNTNGSLSLV